MTERWHERRVEDELLKRELLLRLHEERRGVPGRGAPASEYFRRRVRRMLLRHPLFALRLYLHLLDTGLGHVDGRARSGRRGSLTRASALQRYAHGRVRRPNIGLASRKSGSAAMRLGTEFRRQGSLWDARLLRGLRMCRAAGAAVVIALRKQGELWFARLVRGSGLCRSLTAALAMELRRAGAVLVRGLQALGAALDDLVARRRRHRLRAALTSACASVRNRFPRPARGVLAGIVLSAVAASAVLFAMRNLGPSAEGTAVGPGLPTSSHQGLHGFLHLRLSGTSPTKPRPTKHIERAPKKAAPRAKPRVAQRMTLVSNTVPTASVLTRPTVRTPAPTPQNVGPSPLRAPPGGSGPSPLKAP